MARHARRRREPLLGIGLLLAAAALVALIVIEPGATDAAGTTRVAAAGALIVGIVLATWGALGGARS